MRIYDFPAEQQKPLILVNEPPNDQIPSALVNEGVVPDTKPLITPANPPCTTPDCGALTTPEYVPEATGDCPVNAMCAGGIHGNSKNSQNIQHVYEIYNKITGETYKYGISGNPLNQDGSSQRANQQLKELNSQVGQDIYGARIIQSGIEGRQAALDLEQKLVDDYNKKYGLSPDGNKRPTPSQN